ncbi:MAG: hypothetical protein HYZ51_01775 [Candidatus Doudnabacteria bacterium]|nr:hypothetical protein [Candidatus Doudnabacteria bacterium]
MKIKNILPPKYLFLLLVIISCADLFHYIYLIETTPNGYEFTGLTTDEAITFGLINSPNMNFNNPWNIEKDENIFTTLSLTTPYIYVPLGLAANVLNMTPFWINALAKVVFNIIFFIVAYNFIGVFTKRKNTAFIIFLIVSGLSGILYIIAVPFGKNALQMIGNIFAYYEFEKVTMLHYQLYYNLPKIAGMLAIMFYARKKVFASGVLLGITGLLYPVYGFGFGLGMISYIIAFSGTSKKALKNIISIFVIAGVIIIPWIYTYIVNPLPFNIYSAQYSSSVWLAGIYISFAMSLVFVLYYISRHVKLLRSKLFALFFIVFSVVFSIYQLLQIGIGKDNHLVTEWLTSTNLIGFANVLNNFSVILEIVSVITFLTLVFFVYKSGMKNGEKFLAIWLLLLIAAAIVSPKYVFWFPQRMLFLIRLPIALLATFGLYYFSKKYSISVRKIIAIMIILSIPSLVAAEIRYDRLGREDVTLYSEKDMQALKFLKSQPQGILFSSPKIGSFGPSIANKKSVEFGWPTPIIVGDYSEKFVDYLHFYSSNYTGNKLQIMEKYNVSYVFFGEREMSVSNQSFNPDNLDFLTKIYDSGARIYKVS